MSKTFNWSKASQLFALTLLSGFTALAQNNVSKDSLVIKKKELIPVEIAGIRIVNQAPYSVSDIDSQAIRKTNGVQDIPYLLNQIPSATISSDAGAGVGYTGIRIRGTDQTRINFTINGIPINNPESQGTFFVNMPDLLGSTNSIQIQRGVGSSSNGAASFGASVNMSNLEQGLKPYAEFNSDYGSFQTFRNSIKAGTGKLKNGFQFDLKLAKISSDGFIERSASDLKSLQFISGWTSKNEKTSVKFNLMSGKEKTGQAWGGVPEDSLKTNRRYNGLGLMEDGTYYSDQSDNYQQDYYQFFVNHQLNNNWDIHGALFLTRGKGFYNEYRMGQAFEDYGRQPYITPSNDTFLHTNLIWEDWLDNYFYGFTYNANYQKNNTKLNLGGSLNRYDGKHFSKVTWADFGFPQNFSSAILDAQKTDFNIYAKAQQQVGTYLHLFGDIQYRFIDYRMNGFRNDIARIAHPIYHFLNPKVGASYYFNHAANSESKLYASFAIAHKEPNRQDFESKTDGLPDPEVLYDTELGYHFKAHQWSMGVNLYYMYYKNQLILTGKLNDVGEYMRQNIPNSHRAGIEWIAAYKPFDWLHLNANATLSQNKIKNFSEFVDDYDMGGQQEFKYSRSDIAFSPSFIGYFAADIEPFFNRWEKQKFFINLEGKHISRQYLDNTSNKARSIDPYSIANIQFRYSVKDFLGKELGLKLSLNNVFNKKYESNGYTFSYFYNQELITENYYYPQAGFNFILGVGITF